MSPDRLRMMSCGAMPTDLRAGELISRQVARIIVDRDMYEELADERSVRRHFIALE